MKNDQPLEVVREYKDSDDRYANFPEQQGKTRSVESVSGTFPGSLRRVVVERRVYNPDAPHPDNCDW